MEPVGLHGPQGLDSYDRPAEGRTIRQNRPLPCPEDRHLARRDHRQHAAGEPAPSIASSAARLGALLAMQAAAPAAEQPSSQGSSSLTISASRGVHPAAVLQQHQDRTP